MEGATILVQKFERQANAWEPEDAGTAGQTIKRAYCTRI